MKESLLSDCFHFKQMKLLLTLAAPTPELENTKEIFVATGQG